MDKMKIAYLHIGSPQNGICRYGRLLANEARQRDNICVIEANIILTNDRKYNELILANAAQKLLPAEIVHIQYSIKHNHELWGKGWKQLYYLWFFKRHCQNRCVVTLHDIYDLPPSLKTLLKNLYNHLKVTNLLQNHKFSNTQAKDKLPNYLTPKKTLKYIWSMYKPDMLSLIFLLNFVQRIFVCSEEEIKRLNTLADSDKIGIIPHFVEQRSLPTNIAETRRELKLYGCKTVIILGFIHGRKGHKLMIEALPYLPQNMKVIFAGGANPSNEKFVEELIALAKTKAVNERLQITGYLSEEELEKYLVATDLAVCPFQFFSASGSLSTWISANRPVLAYDLPQIAEYNNIESNAIKTFTPYSPIALATAIRQIIEVDNYQDNSAMTRLQERLSITAIFDQHLSHYHDARDCFQTRRHPRRVRLQVQSPPARTRKNQGL